MRICILSRNNAPIGFMDNSAPEAMHFYDDKLHVYLTGTAHTFEFTVSSDHDDAALLITGNKLAFVYKEKQYYMTIMTTTETETELTVEAWSLSFELLNETVNAYSAPKAMSFTEYITAFDFETSFLEIGLNEVSTKKITHEWTSDTDTVLSRLYSLANVFSAEIEFIPVLASDYSLEKVVLNVYREHSDSVQGIGHVRDDIRFRYGKDIDGITKTEDITELYTAIRPYGKDDLNLSSMGATSVYNDDDDLEYYHAKGSLEILAPLARDQFPSTITEGSDNYIAYVWKTDYDSVSTLYGNALAKLKTLCKPASKYEITGYIDADIGDTVTIIDEAFKPALYLETRVTEQEISFTRPDKNKTTFDSTTTATGRSSSGSSSTENTQDAADYVEEYGDSGSYDTSLFFNGHVYWQKWASGKLEIWGNVTCSSNAYVNNSSWGNGFSSDYFTCWGKWPVAFTANPVVNIQMMGADSDKYNGDYMMLFKGPVSTDDSVLTHAPQFKFWRGTTKTFGHPKLAFRATGLWK